MANEVVEVSDRTTWRLESQNEQLREVARLRLTNAEREAVFAAWCYFSHGVPMERKPTKEIAATLRGLLGIYPKSGRRLSNQRDVKGAT